MYVYFTVYYIATLFGILKKVKHVAIIKCSKIYKRMCLFYFSFIAEFLFVKQMAPLCFEGFTAFSFSIWFQTMLIINYMEGYIDLMIAVTDNAQKIRSIPQ